MYPSVRTTKMRTDTDQQSQKSLVIIYICIILNILINHVYLLQGNLPFYEFQIKITALRSKFGEGYVAFDDYVMQSEIAECPTLPPDAAILPETTPPSQRTTTRPPVTTPPPFPFPNCDFSVDMCAWIQVQNIDLFLQNNVQIYVT